MPDLGWGMFQAACVCVCVCACVCVCVCVSVCGGPGSRLTVMTDSRCPSLGLVVDASPCPQPYCGVPAVPRGVNGCPFPAVKGGGLGSWGGVGKADLTRDPTRDTGHGTGDTGHECVLHHFPSRARARLAKFGRNTAVIPTWVPYNSTYNPIYGRIALRALNVHYLLALGFTRWV